MKTYIINYLNKDNEKEITFIKAVSKKDAKDKFKTENSLFDIINITLLSNNIYNNLNNIIEDIYNN